MSGFIDKLQKYVDENWPIVARKKISEWELDEAANHFAERMVKQVEMDVDDRPTLDQDNLTPEEIELDLTDAIRETVEKMGNAMGKIGDTEFEVIVSDPRLCFHIGRVTVRFARIEVEPL